MRHRFFPLALAGLVACGGQDRPQSGAGETAEPGTPPAAAVADPAAPPTAELPTGDPADVPIGPGPDGGTDVAVTGPGAPPAPGGATAPAPPAAPQQTPPAGTGADDILDRAERAHAQVRSMEADFVQEVYVPLLDSTVHSRGRIFHRTPDRFLMRFSDPQGDVIVADGRYVWMYYPSSDPMQVMRSPLGAGGQQVDLHREFLSNATARYQATRTGTESVGGRPAHALTLVPRTASPYRRIRIWVDTGDFLVRRFEIVEENESVRRLEMSNLRPNVTLADDLFRFTPPQGAQVFEP